MLLLVGLSLATPAGAGAGAQPGQLTFGPCAPRQIFTPVKGLQCATLPVPFDRGDPTLGDIGLAVQRLAARGPHIGTIVLLAGGPGQPALPAFEEFLAPLERQPALRGFELVTFDQRGTGQSEALQCPRTGESRARTLAGQLGECGAALGGTRPFYTSQESVEDLSSLRESLGGIPLSLLAVSYGGRVAGMYAREHPAGVARMVLDSPSALTGSDALGAVRVKALRRVLDEGICGGGACRAFSSDVFADLTRLVAALHHHPLHTRIYNASGNLQWVSVTEAQVLKLLSTLDLPTTARKLVPAAITAAAHGDVVPLARLTSRPSSELRITFPLARLLAGESLKAQAPASEAAVSEPLFTATFCDESELPWSPSSMPAERPAIVRRWLASASANAFAPFAVSTVVSPVLKLCIDWPPTPPAPAPPTGVSAVPTLLLSGEDDLRTPYEQTLALAAGYSDERLLRIPDTGHSTVTTDLSGCARRAMLEFLTTGNAPASCAPSSEPQALALPPGALGEVPPAASRSPLAGRVASAAVLTLEDLFGQTMSSGGGLRGGSWAYRARALVLHGTIDVPGVALSGTVRVVGTSPGHYALTGRLTVRGRLAGKLFLHGRALYGRVGGASAHARLAAL